MEFLLGALTLYLLIGLVLMIAVIIDCDWSEFGVFKGIGLLFLIVISWPYLVYKAIVD